MNASVKSQFDALSQTEKALFLSLVIHSLTVSARSYGFRGETPSELGRQKLACINEIIHTASGKLSNVISPTKYEYPDDVFIDMLFESSSPHCEPDLQDALSFAFERTGARAANR